MRPTVIDVSIVVVALLAAAGLGLLLGSMLH
jgi:hypothetical protein